MDDGQMKVLVFVGAGLVALLFLAVRHFFRRTDGSNKASWKSEPALKPRRGETEIIQQDPFHRSQLPFMEEEHTDVENAHREPSDEHSRAPEAPSKGSAVGSIGSVFGNLALFFMFGPFAIIYFLVRNSLRKSKKDI